MAASIGMRARAAASDTPCDIRISEATLGEALGALFRECGTRSLYPSDLARTRVSRSVTGRLSSIEALRRLLRGSDLTVRLTAGGIVTISRRTEGKDAPMTHRTRHSLLGGISILLASLLGSQPARAQDAAHAAAEPPAQDIIVTARRVEERLQDVPISITVFNQQQLNNRNIVRAQDLATYTPSLSTNTGLGSQNTTFAIRGFVQDNGTQPSVGVYFADVVSPRGASNNIPVGDGAGPGAFFDLQNVQVLKGPQGTLFGRNTTGGAILLVPQKPTAKLDGYVEGSYGNYDLKRIQAVLNLPLSDAARFRVGVDHESRDGYLRSDSGIGPHRFDDIDYVAVRASLVVDLTPTLENYSIASYSRSDTHGDLQKLILCDPTAFLGARACDEIASERARGAGFYTVQNSLPDAGIVQRQFQLINTTTWRASDTLSLKNIVSYAQLREDFRSAVFGVNLNIVPGEVFTVTDSKPIPGHTTSNQSTFTEEFQVQGSALEDRLTWQTGGYLEISDPVALAGAQSPILLSCTDSDTFACSNPLGFGSIDYTSTKTYFHNVGAYGQATYKLSDYFALTGGLRYTWDRVTNDSHLISYQFPAAGMPVPLCTDPTLTPPTCAVRYRERSHAPTWLVDLDYKPNSDILLYLKYARGYRAGGIAASAPVEFAAFRPEKVDTYEAGLKTSFHGPLRGTFNVAAFYNDFSNQQLQLSLNPKPGAAVVGATGIFNAGKSRIYGLEIETSIKPVRGLTLDGGYTYLSTRLQSVSTPVTPANSPYEIDSILRRGDSLVLSPRNKLTVTGSYQLPLDESLGPVVIGATFTHSDRQRVNYVDAFSPVPGASALSFLPSLNLLNLNLNWNSVVGTPIDLSLFATNVTARHYYTIFPGLIGAFGFETAQVGEPRTYGVRLRYRFGR